jgi:hypothetical protein
MAANIAHYPPEETLVTDEGYTGGCPTGGHAVKAWDHVHGGVPQFVRIVAIRVLHAESTALHAL